MQHSNEKLQRTIDNLFSKWIYTELIKRKDIGISKRIPRTKAKTVSYSEGTRMCKQQLKNCVKFYKEDNLTESRIRLLKWKQCKKRLKYEKGKEKKILKLDLERNNTAETIDNEQMYIWI